MLEGCEKKFPEVTNWSQSGTRRTEGGRQKNEHEVQEGSFK